MRKICLLAIIGLFLSSNLWGQETLKIMSYNIKAATAAPIEEISWFLATEDVDIIALQECDWNNKRAEKYNSGCTDLVNVLAHETKMFPLYAKSIDFADGYYGLGILSKYPIVKSERILLPNPTGDEQRILLKADIELPSGEIITFICTHLDYKSEKVKIQQVKAIEKCTHEKNLTFIAGDFNADPSSPSAEMMRHNWTDLTNREFTFSTSKPEEKLDYIYVKNKQNTSVKVETAPGEFRPGKRVELISTKVINDQILSDHFPVVSVVEIHPDPKKVILRD